MSKKQDNNSTETLVDPRKAYYTDDFPRQRQEAPGVEEKMTPKPDAGERSYRGSGRLRGRKALITGGDSGIGRAVAIAYAREGADVAIGYLPSEQQDADTLRTLLEEEKRRIELLPGDIRDEEVSRESVRRAAEKLGGLDILVLNAGMQQAVKHIEDLTTEQLRRTFETNVYPMFWMVQEALPCLRPGASIITTSSIEAFEPSPILLDYAATKSAIAGFTRALAKQLADKGIRVNSVAPGPVWTALQVTGGQPPEKIPEFGQSTPLGRAGQPAELASVYVFLASEESSFVSAQVIGVTGGRLTY
ncbi:SDR family oxidoreductase [Alistipes sp.]|uniref:SDR family oxidoreductase n=1 Tax=Alistipes sp. TaxID=1872444 RepID=UPI003AF0D681